MASVTKVRLEKYSIKAEVFDEGLSCTMKARVYSQDGKYAIEVQRHAGDAFVLQSTYRLLFAFLEAQCGGVSEKGDAPVQTVHSVPPKLEPTGKEEEEDTEKSSAEAIAPLLMMATVAGLQAEAASALAAMVRGGRDSAAPVLTAPTQVASALTDLLASSCVDTVYPAARCVSDLAAFGEADSILCHRGLLLKVAVRAIAELRNAKGLVGTALAQAVVDAIRCCAGRLPSTVARELQQVLDDAVNDEFLKTNSLAHTYLEQAWHDTKLLA